MFARRLMKPNRCLAASLAGVLALLILPFGSRAAGAAEAQGQYLLYIGTEGAHAKGIYAYRFDQGTGDITDIGLAAETPSPFFLVASRNGRYLYSALIGHHPGQESGFVSAFAINSQTGKLTFLDQVSSRGLDPAYVSMDGTGRFVLVANYTGGTVAVLPVHEDGSLGEATGFAQHAGSGPDPNNQQERPHPHSIITSSDNRFALAADVGLNKLFVYRFDSTRGSLSPAKPPFAVASPHSGPRHFVFSPNGKFVYAIGETGSDITVFSYKARQGTLRNLQAISTLPKEFSGNNTGAEIQIAPSGKFLYGSNRGDDTIAVFAVDPHKGTLTSIGYVPSGGKTPWMFAFDPSGSYVFVANKGSSNVVVFRVDQKTGLLTPTGRVLNVPDPVCVTFVAVQ